MQRGNLMQLHCQDFEMQKWNISIDIAQKVDEKNGVICLAIMSTVVTINCRSSNCDYFFAAISRKYKKWAIFDILMTIIL